MVNPTPLLSSRRNVFFLFCLEGNHFREADTFRKVYLLSKTTMLDLIIPSFQTCYAQAQKPLYEKP